MPLLENDVIFAYLNESDRNHTIAEKSFKNFKTTKSKLKSPV